jgi:hypothetical protein
VEEFPLSKKTDDHENPDASAKKSSTVPRCCKRLNPWFQIVQLHFELFEQKMGAFLVVLKIMIKSLASEGNKFVLRIQEQSSIRFCGLLPTWLLTMNFGCFKNGELKF